jgi:transposase InsO family protein
VVVTATFRVMYVFVILEVGTRRSLHWNVTAHPTADWTAQQFRMTLLRDEPHRFVIHDRDTIYSKNVDKTLAAMGLAVLKAPVRAPQANAFCERLVGTIRRECLDLVIPLSERHIRRLLQQWVAHYNRGRPHASLGPGIPDPRLGQVVTESRDRRIPAGYRVVATPILAGLHHEYGLEREVA